MYSSYKAQSLAMKNLKTLLISANVGSLFDDPENLFKKWLNQFYQVVRDKDPDFIALHCQEVGGKKLCPVNAEREKVDSALGSLYFVHSRVVDIRIWDFASSDFVNVKDTKVYDGSIESVGEKDKQKFPLELFPNRTWSRKGYMRTRWQVGRLSFDLVNVHLFHDDSNLESMSR
uniref:Inositol-polyphosphate 5-phosphatase n=1 Tax=Macrostomum lignano TaxID=282301 RepID=A0A1I8F899_9PLAT